MKEKSSIVAKWSVIAALGGFLFGFDTAVISGVEKNIETLFNLTSFSHGLAISSALIGTLFGALFGGWPADKYGRKPALLAIGILFAVSAVGSAVANSLSSFVVYRFIGGIAVGASSVVAPMYISEISPAKLRGRMTALFQFNVIFGILMAYVSNYFLRDGGENAWRWMLGMGAFPAVLYSLLLFIIPESPLYLLKKGKMNEATDVLTRYSAQVQTRITEMQEGLSVKQEKLFSGRFKKPIAIAFLVAMFNQFSGINAILYYAPRIFEMSGVSKSDSFLQSVIIGLTNALFTILGMAIIDRVGRKKLLIWGSMGMAVCLGCIAYVFSKEGSNQFALLYLLIGYIMFFAFSTGAVIWVLISEVFPGTVRAQGQSLGAFTHWFFATVITFLFPAVVEKSVNGSAYAFAFFCVMMIVQAVTVWKYFPETKGKTLEALGHELSVRA
ncbi:MAG: sugar porter family MFS transporter [Agriterribacter sp.]